MSKALLTALALGFFLGPAGTLAHSQQRLDDPTIVAIFDGANAADVETGQLAMRRAQSKAVRALAQRFANDHRMVQQQGRDLAKKLGVTPTPPQPDPYAADHQAAMILLSQKSGAEFDRAYLQHEVAYHQAVIDAITTTLLPAIQNGELKALVKTVVPAFQNHLQAAQQLQKEIASR